jgi:hypothetical protein
MYQNIVFGTSGSEKVRIDSSGRVGIGTDNPVAYLDIDGSFNNTRSLQLRSGDWGYDNPLDSVQIAFSYSGRYTSVNILFEQGIIL